MEGRLRWMATGGRMTTLPRAFRSNGISGHRYGTPKEPFSLRNPNLRPFPSKSCLHLEANGFFFGSGDKLAEVDAVMDFQSAPVDDDLFDDL